MNRMEYDDRDYLADQLTSAHRRDLIYRLPVAGDWMSRNAQLFWQDVLARFRRGEVWDAVTAIERRFRPRNGWYGPEDNNAYHFVEPV